MNNSAKPSTPDVSGGTSMPVRGAEGVEAVTDRRHPVRHQERGDRTGDHEHPQDDLDGPDGQKRTHLAAARPWVGDRLLDAAGGHEMPLDRPTQHRRRPRSTI